MIFARGIMPSEKRKSLQRDAGGGATGRALLSRREWLGIFDQDPAQAEEKYLEFYQKLVLYFEWNRRPDPEDLAQETFRRGRDTLSVCGQARTVKADERPLCLSSASRLSAASLDSQRNGPCVTGGS